MIAILVLGFFVGCVTSAAEPKSDPAVFESYKTTDDTAHYSGENTDDRRVQLTSGSVPYNSQRNPGFVQGFTGVSTLYEDPHVSTNVHLKGGNQDGYKTLGPTHAVVTGSNHGGLVPTNVQAYDNTIPNSVAIVSTADRYGSQAGGGPLNYGYGYNNLGSRNPGIGQGFNQAQQGFSNGFSNGYNSQFGNPGFNRANNGVGFSGVIDFRNGVPQGPKTFLDRDSYRNFNSFQYGARNPLFGFGGNLGNQQGFGGSLGNQQGFGGSLGNQQGFGGSLGTQQGFGGSLGTQQGFGGSLGNQQGFGGGLGNQQGFGGGLGNQQGFGGGLGNQQGFGGSLGNQQGFGGISQGFSGNQQGFPRSQQGFAGNGHFRGSLRYPNNNGLSNGFNSQLPYNNRYGFNSLGNF